MLLFRSEEHVQAWREPRGVPKGALLTVRQQWLLAKKWYSTRMDEAWRRRTPEEAEEVFTSLGLTGDFWRLRP